MRFTKFGHSCVRLEKLTLWANPQITAQFTEFGDRVHELRHGDVLSAAGSGVHVCGQAGGHDGLESIWNTA
jgi:hypothetical protein